MSHYKPYPAYKDSGVEWIGEVPAEWDVKRLGFFFEERREKVSDKDFPPLSVTKGGVVPQIEGVAKTEDNDNRKKACDGDFVINSRSDRKGSSGLAGLDGSVSLINTVLRGGPCVVGRYIHHLLRSAAFQEEYYRYGNGIVADLWTTHYSEMRNIGLAMPPIADQLVIAVALDRETARIDALIAKKTEFIDLLTKKRQALIAHAVTKGLDPNVKMKESGVEWIGEVPEHWEVLRLANIGPLVKGNGGTKADDAEDGMPCIRYGDLYTTYDFLIHKIKKFIRPESAPDYTQIKYGDLLLAASGETFEEIGKSAVNLDERQAVCGGDVIILRPVRKVDPTFLGYAAGSVSAQTQKSLMGKGFTVIHVYGDSLRNLLIAAPTDEEQKQIGVVIDRKTARIDALIAKIKQSIDLLKERRSAFITAAVTGQIDLREGA